MFKKNVFVCVAVLLTGCASVANGRYTIEFPKASIEHLEGIRYGAKMTVDQRPGLEAPVKIGLQLLNNSTKPLQTNMFADSIQLFSDTGAEYKVELSGLSGYPYDGRTINPGGSTTYSLPVSDRAIHAMIINGNLKTMVWRIGNGSFRMDAKYPVKS